MPHPYRAITFDCFGTLIDWRFGMERVLRQLPSLQPHGDSIDDVLAARERAEQALESDSYRSYANVLSESVDTAVKEVLGVELTSGETRAFAAGQLGWPPHADTQEALARLASEYPIGLLSNCDAQTLRLSAHKHLRAPIAFFVSAEEVQSYKPAPAHWMRALEITGVAPADILHVSYAPQYDLYAAQALGFPIGFVQRYDTPLPADLEVAHQGAGLSELVDAILSA